MLKVKKELKIYSIINPMSPLAILIVEKTGIIKPLQIKEYKEEELFKKCGFKVSTGFSKQTEWKIKLNGNTYLISVYGKTNGKANTENKYDFPPPIDNTLFFGACAILGNQLQLDNTILPISLTADLWEKCYEKLFGGFEDLASTCIKDENEIDELANMDKSKKTKTGYLKDGFVVDSDSDLCLEDDFETEEDTELENGDADADVVEEDDLNIEELDIGSELSEESYESYDEDDVDMDVDVDADVDDDMDVDDDDDDKKK